MLTLTWNIYVDMATSDGSAPPTQNMVPKHGRPMVAQHCHPMWLRRSTFLKGIATEFFWLRQELGRNWFLPCFGAKGGRGKREEKRKWQQYAGGAEPSDVAMSTYVFHVNIDVKSGWLEILLGDDAGSRQRLSRLPLSYLFPSTVISPPRM